MAKPTSFTGTLNSNSVFTTLFNMIISQEVFSDNIVLKGTLVDMFRTDGTLYGDTKLFYATDVGKLTNFPNNNQTLLSKNLPADPEVQNVVVDKFKQTTTTVDGVRSKQAFMSKEVYGAFVSVTVQWLRNTYNVFQITLINTFVGTTVSEAEKAEIEVDFETFAVPEVTGVVDLNAQNIYMATKIGQELADLVVDLKDPLRDYNDYGFLRAYDTSEFVIVWNKKYSNLIKHVALPLVFHKDDVIPRAMDSIVLNDRYFGTLQDGGTTDGTTRTIHDMIVEINGEDVQLFPGDLIPSGETIAKHEHYKVDEDIICKIVHRRSVPFMSALVISTEFFNAKDLDRNHYLTFGYSEPTYLKNYPFLTMVKASE